MVSRTSIVVRSIRLFATFGSQVKKMTAPKWYDFTIYQERAVEHNVKSIKDLAQIFEQLGADRFVIGDETGEGGLRHWQCRVVFKTEKDEGHLRNVFGPIGHVSPTHVRDFKYCEKEGHYYRSWETALNKYATIKLLDWQDQAVGLINEQSDREVLVIVDPEGNHGKSWLRKYMQVNRICQYIPQMDDAKDIMRIAMKKAGSGYCFDLPRADSDRRNREMWRAIEQIKDGYLYEDRYTFQEMWIDPPKIIVFTNDMPPMDTLSNDRWKIYGINRYGALEQVAYE